MHKLAIILSFLFLFANITKADKCEQINCNQIKDYINAKLIQGCIEKIAEKDKKEKTNYDVFKSKLESNTIEKPLSYTDLSKLLNDNNFKSVSSKIGEKINAVNFSIENIENNDTIAEKIFHSVAIKLTAAQKAGIKDYDKLKADLILQIKTYINTRVLPESNASIEKAEDLPNTQQEQTEVTSENSEAKTIKEYSSSWLNTILYPGIIPLVFLIIIFLLLNSKINELKMKYRNLKSENENYKMSSRTNSNQNQNNFQQNVTISKSEFEKYLGNSERFESFKNELEKLKNQIAIIEKPKSTNNQYQNESNVQITPTNLSNDIFYMKYPVANSFSNNHKSNTKENTIYKFRIKSNKTEADFEIHTEGVKIEEIISMVEKAIKSGCEENNIPTNSTKNIRTIKSGLVTLEGDKWVIKQKAMIKYE
jgi:hypothetical protein